MKHLGENIKKLRKARGWNQEALARKVGINQSMVSQFENGSKEPSLQVFVKIAKKLKVSYAELIDGKPDSKQVETR